MAGTFVAFVHFSIPSALKRDRHIFYTSKPINETEVYLRASAEAPLKQLTYHKSIVRERGQLAALLPWD